MNAPCTLIEVLTPMWQRVLQRSSISVEDNFFDLGGDPSLAIELFREIVQVCGRELPPVTICQAPTIAALAALLTQPATPRIPALVPLKAGTEHPPIFIAHGLGDTVMGLVRLARHIQSPHPVFGMQARGVDGVDNPFGSIEEMAQFHLQAIRQLQPQGPFFLVGYSLGGLVTLEIAQRLSEDGEEVALLAMLDSYPDIHHLSAGQRARLTLGLARRRAATVMQSFRHGRRSQTSGNRDGSAIPWPLLPTKFDSTMQRMRDCDYLALRRYRPRFYRGKINFVRASISSSFPVNPVAVWANLVDEFEVETVAGDHLGMLTTHFESLASVISRYVREAFS